MADGDFIEAYVSADLETCESRDVKGLYAKARRRRDPGVHGDLGSLRGAGEARARDRYGRPDGGAERRAAARLPEGQRLPGLEPGCRDPERPERAGSRGQSACESRRGAEGRADACMRVGSGRGSFRSASRSPAARRRGCRAFRSRRRPSSATRPRAGPSAPARPPAMTCSSASSRSAKGTWRRPRVPSSGQRPRTRTRPTCRGAWRCSRRRATTSRGALRYAERAVELEPDGVDERLFLGRLYRLRRDVAGAERALLWAEGEPGGVPGQPVSADAALLLPQLYLQVERPLAAADVAKAGIALDDRHLALVGALATAYQAGRGARVGDRGASGRPGREPRRAGALRAARPTASGRRRSRRGDRRLRGGPARQPEPLRAAPQPRGGADPGRAGRRCARHLRADRRAQPERPLVAGQARRARGGGGTPIAGGRVARARLRGQPVARGPGLRARPAARGPRKPGRGACGVRQGAARPRALRRRAPADGVDPRGARGLPGGAARRGAAGRAGLGDAAAGALSHREPAGADR